MLLKNSKICTQDVHIFCCKVGYFAANFCKQDAWTSWIWAKQK